MTTYNLTIPDEVILRTVSGAEEVDHWWNPRVKYHPDGHLSWRTGVHEVMYGDLVDITEASPILRQSVVWTMGDNSIIFDHESPWCFV